MSAVCPVCGSQATGAYCSTCGNPVSREAVAAPAAVQRPSKARPAARRPVQAPAAAHRPGDWRRRVLAVLVGVLVVGGAAAAGYSLANYSGTAPGTSQEAVPARDVANRSLEEGTAALAQGDRTAATAAFRKAVRYWEQAMQEDPDDLYAPTFLGLTRFYLGDRAAAFAGTEQVLSRDPRYLWALFNGAWMAETSGRIPDALRYYERYIEAAPTERADIVKYAEHPQLIDLQLDSAREAVARLKEGLGS